jgi:cell division protease FtsH
MNPDRSAARLVRALVAGLFVLVVALALALHGLAPSTSGKEVGLDEVKELASEHQIKSATFLDQDDRVVLRTQTTNGASSRTLWASYPASGGEVSALVAALVNGGASVEVQQQTGKHTLSVLTQFILPLVLLADLFGIFIMLARGGAGQLRELFAFSRIGVRADAGTRSAITFGDVAAADEMVAELAEVRDYLASPARYVAMGASPPKGVLLYGPPGCGKTLLARALAGEAKVPFFFISGSEFVESLVGVGAARVRDLFRQAKAAAPAILFVDELDAAGRRRGAGLGGGHDEREQTLNELLVQMDGFDPSLGVVVVGATNRPDILDPALLRPGRFDRQIHVDPPDVRGRLDILQLHARPRRLDRDADLASIARGTPGFTGADLANVMNEAALLAVRRRGSTIGNEDLREAVDRVVSGPRRRGRLLTDEERQRLAYHEAGHAVVAHAVDPTSDVRRVSIVARGRAGGHADVARSDRTLLTRDELLGQLVVLLAGSAAEELVLGQPSTAAETDLEQATELARAFTARYGMTAEVGRVHVLAREGEVFLGRDYMAGRQVSTSTLAKVEDAVRELIDRAAVQARRMLSERRATLDRLASQLLEYETLTDDELATVLGDTARPRTRRRATSRS